MCDNRVDIAHPVHAGGVTRSAAGSRGSPRQGVPPRLARQPSDSGAEQRTAIAEAKPAAAPPHPAPASGAEAASRRFPIGSVDLLAGAMWLAIALGVVLFATHMLPFTGGKRHHPGAATVAQPTAAATAAPSVTAAGTPATTPAPPLLTGAAPDAGLLRPGAALIERDDLLDPAGAGRTIVVYSSAAGVDGCDHPYVDVWRRAAGGAWKT